MYLHYPNSLQQCSNIEKIQRLSQANYGLKLVACHQHFGETSDGMFKREEEIQKGTLH